MLPGRDLTRVSTSRHKPDQMSGEYKGISPKYMLQKIRSFSRTDWDPLVMANGESPTSTTRVRDNAATPDCAPPQSQNPVNRGAGSMLLSTGEVRFRRLAAATDKAQKTLDGSCFDIQSVHDFETHVRTMMDDTSTTVLPALVGQSSDSSDDFSDDFGLPRPPPEPPPSRRPRRRWERWHSSDRLRSVCSPQPVPSSRPSQTSCRRVCGKSGGCGAHGGTWCGIAVTRWLLGGG